MGVLAMAVSDTAEAMQAFMARGGWSFPVTLVADELAMRYGISAIPTLVVIDSGGRVVDTMLGVVSADRLASIVDGL